MLGPTLETQRLLLRPPEQQDFAAWATMMANPDAMLFMGGPQPRAGAWRTMSLMTGAWVVRGFSNFSVIEKSSGKWIGRAGPWEPEGWPGKEIGWAFDPSAWGQGYATEAAKRCLDWVFSELSWTEAIHIIDPLNKPSIAVALRLGSKRKGETTLPPPSPSSGAIVEVYGQQRQL